MRNTDYDELKIAIRNGLLQVGHAVALEDLEGVVALMFPGKINRTLFWDAVTGMVSRGELVIEEWATRYGAQRYVVLGPYNDGDIPF